MFEISVMERPFLSSSEKPKISLNAVFANENLGMSTLVHGRLMQKDGTECAITCKLRGWCDYKAGDTVKVQFVKRHFFDRETTNAIR